MAGLSQQRLLAGRWQHWDGWSGDHLSAAAGLRWLLSKITCIWSSRLWFVSVPTAKWRQRQLPAAQRDNWKVKVRRCHKISTSPDVPQSPVRASTKWWRMFKSAQSCCPHSRKEEIRVRPWRRSTLQWLRWIRLYRQQLLAWFFTRRSSLGEEQRFLLKSHLEFTQRHVGNSRWPWPGWRFGLWPKIFGHQTRWCLETANSAHHHKRTTSRWSMMAAASSSGDASQQEILQNITKSWRIIPLTQQEDYPLRRRLIFQLEDNHMHAAEAPQKCLETTTRWFWRGRVKAQISVQSRTCVWT